ncbi:FecR family protein [Larkinella rosea]|uniref:FecR family protein n=1 Tax=Larkinella rosea TaxID=2025312 RepID=A0A3P1BTG0_9BACT|nr:FecR family protein [Larkinella rosea]RRB04405.1 FecR family protein [Larkinella rosea]
MKYQNYQLEDFLKDDDFIRWVKNPTVKQNHFWESWLMEHPDKAQTVALARQLILSVRYKHSYQPSEEDLTTVWERIQAGEPSTQSARIVRFPVPAPTLLRFAAIFLITVAAAVTVWRYTLPDKSTKNVTSQAITRLIQTRTIRGQRELIQLPDGSSVKLNAESVLSYSSDFGKTGRALTLEGEAFFEVAHDASKPFIIQTGKLRTTVVGTSFNINAYPENPDITVAVLTGKVKVGAASKAPINTPDFLVPSDLYSYQKSSEKGRKEQVNLDELLAWKDDVIILKNADFQEIKKKLERWYAVNFVVQKGLKVKEDFSARFNNTSLKSILDALNYTSNFQYELVNNTVFVTQKK